MSARASTFVFISQVYVPDPASAGQHAAEAASELARRGHRVIVFTSARGYDDPSLRYPSREVRDGVEIRRLPLASFGKSATSVRVVGGLLFLLQAILHTLLIRHVDTLVVTTAPPMSAIAAIVLAAFRTVRVEYWIMDLNPDLAIALGATRHDALPVRAFNWLNRRMLARADDIVVMDRFMKQRIEAKTHGITGRLHVIPPWPLEDAGEPLAHAQNPFRVVHGLGDQFVVMYSGNHSPVNPLGTLIAAAHALQQQQGHMFLFVGGGIGKREVDARASRNMRSLPYQPLGQLRELLSAADIHVVSIGDAVVGMAHTCKVYGAMAMSRPILLFGPPENHVADILVQENIGWHVAHGDVGGAITTLQQIMAMPAKELEAMGRRARHVVESRLGRAALTRTLCDVFEGAASA